MNLNSPYGDNSHLHLDFSALLDRIVRFITEDEDGIVAEIDLSDKCSSDIAEAAGRAGWGSYPGGRYSKAYINIPRLQPTEICHTAFISLFVIPEEIGDEDVIDYITSTNRIGGDICLAVVDELEKAFDAREKHSNVIVFYDVYLTTDEIKIITSKILDVKTSA